jgi:hypothetical protein
MSKSGRFLDQADFRIVICVVHRTTATGRTRPTKTCRLPDGLYVNGINSRCQLLKGNRRVWRAAFQQYIPDARKKTRRVGGFFVKPARLNYFSLVSL